MAGLKNGCSVYVVFSGKKVKLPVNPEEIKTEYPAEHKTYDVIGVGQVAVPQKPSLKVVSWDGFFPGSRDAPYVNSGAKSPEYYVKYFEKALKKKQKCRLIISRSKLHDTNMRCIVSSFETQDKGGEPHDIYYSLELLEYRPYSPKTVAVITDPDTGEDAAQGGGRESEAGGNAGFARGGFRDCKRGILVQQLRGRPAQNSQQFADNRYPDRAGRAGISDSCWQLRVGTGKPVADRGVTGWIYL